MVASLCWWWSMPIGVKHKIFPLSTSPLVLRGTTSSPACVPSHSDLVLLLSRSTVVDLGLVSPHWILADPPALLAAHGFLTWTFWACDEHCVACIIAQVFVTSSRLSVVTVMMNIALYDV